MSASPTKKKEKKMKSADTTHVSESSPALRTTTTTFCVQRVKKGSTTPKHIVGKATTVVRNVTNEIPAATNRQINTGFAKKQRTVSKSRPMQQPQRKRRKSDKHEESTDEEEADLHSSDGEEDVIDLAAESDGDDSDDYDSADDSGSDLKDFIVPDDVTD